MKAVHLISMKRVWAIADQLLIRDCGNAVSTTTKFKVTRLSTGERVPFPTHILYLDLRGNGLLSLPELPKNLQVLVCSHNEMPVLPSLPESLTRLDCSLNRLEILPTLPEGLRVLNCSYNSIRRLVALPDDLLHLVCRQNGRLVELPEALPRKLTMLDCGYCLLTELPPLPTSLRMLACHNNLLASLPALPDSLTHLNASANNILTNYALPSALRELHFITKDGWDVYQDLPPLLTQLSIRFCVPATTMPCHVHFPIELRSLLVYASDLRETELVFPTCLQRLTLNSCELVQLPPLPPRLVYLNVNRNHLQTLPHLPDTLEELHCTHNLISQLPVLPSGISRLDAAGYAYHRNVTVELVVSADAERKNSRPIDNTA